MSKQKYVKPTVKSFDSVSIAYGSCASGSGEGVGSSCYAGTGAVRFCDVGSGVIEFRSCVDGSGAGAGCGNGSNAF